MLDVNDENDNGGDKSLFKGIRTSKYRHVYGEVARKDQCYENINITKNAHDNNFCAVNPKFVAIVTESYGGGSFVVIPLDKVGRIDVHGGRVTGHEGQIYDIKWDPFNDNVIASGSDDNTIKLWYIPDGGLHGRNLTQPIFDLRGHKRRVCFMEWHPTAEHILFSVGYDHAIIIWNVNKAQPVHVIDCHREAIHSMSFNRDGSLLATTCKDKRLRIISIPEGKVINEAPCHQGTKASKVVFLGDTQRLFTVGFSRYSDRQWAIWSQHDLSLPLTIENIDSSSGVLLPFYDHDTRMIYLAGKGDGNIRYYETTDEPPYCHYLSQFLSGFPQRGLGVMPKRGCDVYRCEVFRFYKLHATKSICEPISMIVPRKSEQFQCDIFSDTCAPTPSLTAEQWLAGEVRNPILLNLKTGAGAKTNKVMLRPMAGQAQTLADFNNERKFQFIAQVNALDYRDKSSLKPNGKERSQTISLAPSMGKQEQSEQENTNTNGRRRHSEDVPGRNDDQHQAKSASARKSRLPWLKDKPEEVRPIIPVCDIVTSKELPKAAFVTINSDSDDSMANTTDDSIAEELNLSNIHYNNGRGQTDTNGGVHKNGIGAHLNNNSNDSVLMKSSIDLNESPSSDSYVDRTVDLFESDNMINPKNERELWAAFQEQRALLHKLKLEIQKKDERIVELEDFITRLNPDDFGPLN